MHFCYIIASGDRTYVGYTTNLIRRLRQHNSEIKGGAKRTTQISKDKSQPRWEYIAIFSCESWDRIRALQVEYICKFPTRKKPCPPCFRKAYGRIQSIPTICQRFQSNEDVRVYVSSIYHELFPTGIVIPADLHQIIL